jgi:hypothetical protein
VGGQDQDQGLGQEGGEIAPVWWLEGEKGEGCVLSWKPQREVKWYGFAREGEGESGWRLAGLPSLGD